MGVRQKIERLDRHDHVEADVEKRDHIRLRENQFQPFRWNEPLGPFQVASGNIDAVSIEAYALEKSLSCALAAAPIEQVAGTDASNVSYNSAIPAKHPA